MKYSILLTIASYNGLLDDAEQPPVSEEHIQKLAALFVRHNAHKTLGVHLIRGHFKTPENTVMLGGNFEKPCGRWTKSDGNRRRRPWHCPWTYFRSYE